MASGYTRQASANIQPNKPINAEDFNAEFNALQTAFDNSTGHDHTGSVTGDGAKISLTAAVSGILPVANGGTGDSTLTAHGILIGNTTNAINTTTAGTTNQILISQGASADPIWADNLNITGTAAITGTVTGGNINTAGTVNATGNITGGTITTAGTLTAAAATLTGTPLPIGSGGTASTTALAAFNAIVLAASSVGADGYIKFQNGLIIQWGNVSFAAANTASVTFPVAFPANVWCVITSITQAAGNGLHISSGASTIIGSSFAFNVDQAVTATGYWIAIGN